MAADVERDEHVRRIVRIHFDPEHGARYWLEHQRRVGYDAISQIRSVAGLSVLGPMEEDALRRRPLTDFVPRSRRGSLVGAVLSETGGTTGPPKRTVFSQAEFHAAFVEPFVRVAAYAGFPRGGNWLWVGPSGPHVIGQAATACAAALGGAPPFSVDFDPRWFRKLPPDSMGRARYLEHVLEQAMYVLECEPVCVLFTTPVVLSRLAERMSASQRAAIRGVHYGGMRVEREVLRRAQTEWCPNAVHLAGYGNSLFGVCMEFGGAPERVLQYYPLGSRLVVRVGVDRRVEMTRLDETVLIANLRERDVADAAALPEDGPAGFRAGIAEPGPAAETAAGVGIY